MSLVAELFAGARSLSPSQRRKYLAERCAGDDAVRAEVESLLAEHDAAAFDTGGFVRRVHEAAAVSLPEGGAGPQGPEPVPERIGPFLVLRVLGEGGMGTVYEAQQREPVQRNVALKVIRRGMDSREVLARFESERRTLASMEHPHVARVLEAGTTADGLPWFAMELVLGTPVTDHCDIRRMDTRARLRLFLSACQAVQHAHNAGVVHRDIKPANLLVAEVDGRPVLKVIDFGIAKAMSADPTGASHVTQVGLVIGTPAYMSPEQASGTEAALDTRTDVYSLGVVLYELLTGCLPFDRDHARTWHLDLASGRAEVPAPSARVLALRGDEAERVAACRSVTPKALAREIAGDLDGIVLRALEPDRARRYETASALAADVQRHLDDEPVEARPPSLAYRAGKLVRKHRATAIAAASLLGALITVAITSAVQSVRLARERDTARHAEAVAQAETRAASEVASLLEMVFALSDPRSPRRDDVTARELLHHGTQAVQAELVDQPLIRARLLATLGRVHDSLGLYAEADLLLREALALRRSHLPGDDPQLADSLNDLGRLALHVKDLDAARRLHEEALSIARATLGPDDPRVMTIVNNLAVDLHEAGDVRAALPLYEQVVAARRRALGSRSTESAEVAQALTNLAVALGETGELERSQSLHEEALAMYRRTVGPRHVAVAESLINLAMLRCDVEDFGAARVLAEEAVAIQREVLGPDHPDLAACLNNLALIVSDLGEPGAAKTLHEEALRIDRRAFGPEHPRVTADLNNLGIVLGEMGEWKAAQAHLGEALAINRRSPGSEVDVATTLGNLASVLIRKGDLASARPLLEESLAIRRATLGPADPTVAEALHDLGSLLRDLGDMRAAQPLLDEAAALQRAMAGGG